jgi:hypothetical protein
LEKAMPTVTEIAPDVYRFASSTRNQFAVRTIPRRNCLHGWDAGVLFEETRRTLFCSDLFHQGNDVEPLTTSDIIERCRATLTEFQASPLANYVPYTRNTKIILEGLALSIQPLWR